jgi:hypothetical protein
VRTAAPEQDWTMVAGSYAMVGHNGYTSPHRAVHPIMSSCQDELPTFCGRLDLLRTTGSVFRDKFGYTLRVMVTVQ